MEVTLNELIESIKKDGVETAETQAEELLAAAREEAEKIVSEARSEAETIRKEADQAAALKERGAVSSIHQAGRNLLLALQKQVAVLYRELLEVRISKKTADDTVLADLLKTVLQSDLSSSGNSVVEVPADQVQGVLSILKKDAADTLKKGYEIKPTKHLKAGFRVVEKDESGYFGITPEVLSDMIGTYLNPELKKLLSESLNTAEEEV